VSPYSGLLICFELTPGWSKRQDLELSHLLLPEGHIWTYRSEELKATNNWPVGDGVLSPPKDPNPSLAKKRENAIKYVVMEHH
jgi:hypothetical protein